ncbi:peroxisomal membrane protein 11C isoform X2 [Sus scrofa]|uniref:peroxisomal membrane protein 11C isoform X2 n=1 Tax=Sus scrofa TaxID=9823 RepID=UPI000A2AFEE1|nr:peroxisomal membrane protein 11C isoform X2 [Sus scrofa]
MAALSGLASALESYRGRDRLIRTLGYCCQLVGGVLVEQRATRSEVGTRLLVLSSQLSHCRTILRLFDDLAMFVYTKQYGLGAEVPVDGPEAETEAEEPPGSLPKMGHPRPAGGLTDRKCRATTRGLSLRGRIPIREDEQSWWPRGKQRAVEAQIRSEVLTLLSNLADLANAVHWLPPGILWSGCLPPWVVGLLGTISSLLSVYQAVQAGGQANADP